MTNPVPVQLEIDKDLHLQTIKRRYAQAVIDAGEWEAAAGTLMQQLQDEREAHRQTRLELTSSPQEGPAQP